MESHLSIGWCVCFRSSWHILNSANSILQMASKCGAAAVLVCCMRIAPTRTTERCKFQPCMHRPCTPHTGFGRETNAHRNTSTFGLHNRKSATKHADCTLHKHRKQEIAKIWKSEMVLVPTITIISRVKCQQLFCRFVLFCSPCTEYNSTPCAMSVCSAYGMQRLQSSSLASKPMEIRNEFTNAILNVSTI